MPVPKTAKIQVFFTGQLVLFEVDRGQRFQVGVNREADDHEFAVIIIPTSPNDPVRPITLPAVATQHNIRLEVFNPLTPGVQRFIPPDGSSPEALRQDFRKVINIDGPDFNPGPLHVASGVLTPSFFIDNGRFYTYDLHGAAVTHPRQNPVPEDIAFVVGADIDFKDGSSHAKLHFFDGAPQDLDLSDAHTTYQIWVENLDIDPTRHPLMNHFQFYYRAFDQVGPGDRADVSAAQGVSPASIKNLFDTHAFPCNPIFSSQSPLG